MAKIPNFKEGQRLSPGTPVQAINTGSARIEGESIAQLGQQIERFGSSYDVYRAARQQAEDALFIQEIQNKAESTAMAADNFARTNPKGAPDGSSVQRDFSSKLQPLVQELDSIEDPRRKRMANEVLNKTQLKYRKNLFGYERKRFDEFVVNKSEENMKAMTLRIANDPSQYGQALSEFDQMVESLPWASDQKVKAMAVAREQAAIAALDHWERKGEYKVARELLQGKLGESFSQEDRQAALKRINTLEEQELDFNFKMEERAIRRREHQRSEQRRAMETDFFSRLYDAREEGDKREAVLLEARELMNNGVMDRKTFKALLQDDEAVAKDVDEQMRFDYTVRFMRGNESIEKIWDDVKTDVANQRLSPSVATQIFKEAQGERQRTAKMPFYAEKAKQANNYLREALPPDVFSSWNPSYSQQRQALINQVSHTALKYRERGMDPIEAMDRAQVEVLGRSNIGVPTVPGIGVEQQSTLEDLEKAKEDVVRNFDSLANKTEQEKRRFEMILTKIEERAAFLRAQRRLDELTKYRKTEVKK